jgi:hypothetical protein
MLVSVFKKCRCTLCDVQVVQVYLSWGNVTVPVPQLQLVGFQRVSLNSGHSVKCVFTITAEQMGVWQDDVTGFDIPLGG